MFLAKDEMPDIPFLPLEPADDLVSAEGLGYGPSADLSFPFREGPADDDVEAIVCLVSSSGLATI